MCEVRGPSHEACEARVRSPRASEVASGAGRRRCVRTKHEDPFPSIRRLIPLQWMYRIRRRTLRFGRGEGAKSQRAASSSASGQREDPLPTIRTAAKGRVPSPVEAQRGAMSSTGTVSFGPSIGSAPLHLGSRTPRLASSAIDVRLHSELRFHGSVVGSVPTCSDEAMKVGRGARGLHRCVSSRWMRHSVRSMSRMTMPARAGQGTHGPPPVPRSERCARSMDVRVDRGSCRKDLSVSASVLSSVPISFPHDPGLRSVPSAPPTCDGKASRGLRGRDRRGFLGGDQVRWSAVCIPLLRLCRWIGTRGDGGGFYGSHPLSDRPSSLDVAFPWGSFVLPLGFFRFLPLLSTRRGKEGGGESPRVEGATPPPPFFPPNGSSATAPPSPSLVASNPTPPLVDPSGQGGTG